MGRWLHAHTKSDEVIRLGGEIGTLAFYSSRYLVDRFSDRSELRTLVDESLKRRDLLGRLARINFYWLRKTDPPVHIDYMLISESRPADESILRAEGANLLKIRRTHTRWVKEGTIRIISRAAKDRRR